MELIFQQSEPRTTDIHSFHFKPLKPLAWIAGQSIKLELVGPYGPTERRFTIASPPYTGIVTVTTRLSGSDYKNALSALKPGDTAKGYATSGDFYWRESPAAHTFVAAGIGITPFYAIIAQRAHEQKPVAASLIYGAAHQDFIYKDQLNEWLTPTYIPDRHLTVADIPQTDGLIYLSGPSAMIDELGAALIGRGTPESQIIYDWFTGRFPTED